MSAKIRWLCVALVLGCSSSPKHGTITPLAIGFVVGNSIAWLGWRWAIAASRNP